MKKGFTILEVIITMSIISILMLAAVPSFLNYLSDARELQLDISATTINKAVIAYDLMYLQGTVNGNTPAKLSENEIGGYISGDIKIVSEFNISSTGTGHHKPSEEGEVCIHILRPGSTYSSAGVRTPITETQYLLEMYDVNTGNTRVYIDGNLSLITDKIR